MSLRNSFLLTLIVCATASAQFPTNFRVLPQFISGNTGGSPGWYSAIYLNNPNATAFTVPVHFYDSNGQPMQVQGPNGMADTINPFVQANGMARIEALNDGPQKIGWVAIELPSAMYANGVFRLSIVGQPDQEAVVPLSSNTAQRVSMIFDDTDNMRTGVAMVNPSSTDTVVNITARDEQGIQIGTTTMNVAARSKAQDFFLATQAGLTAITGKKGTVEFSVPSGAIAVLGLRARGNAFTSVPTAER